MPLMHARVEVKAYIATHIMDHEPGEAPVAPVTGLQTDHTNMLATERDSGRH